MSIFRVFHSRILDSFEKYKVEYLLIGGHAAIFYGVRRTTSDIDLIKNKENLKRSGNKSLIDQFDVSELKKIFNIEN